MNLIKKLMMTLALSASFAAPALATVIQTTAPASSFDSNWSSHTLGTVAFAAGTNLITGLTSSVTIKDQGWGGQDPNSNHVVIGLFNNDQWIWSQHVAGATHNWTTQAFDITEHAASLASLNLALRGVNWAADPALTMKMVTSSIGYGGWSLSTQNASFSVTSGEVPEPGSIALLALGLAGLAFSRKKFAQ